MRLEKCWFCSSTVYPGHGICFVRNDSKLFRFCRSKCHKNFKMKRNPRKVKWTKAYRMIHGKDLSDDNVFNFERRRNRPVKYSRELSTKTMAAIKTVEEVRLRRERRHHEQRMRGISDEIRKKDRKELQQQVHLVNAPSAVPLKNAGVGLTTQKIRVVAMKQSQASGLYD